MESCRPLSRRIPTLASAGTRPEECQAQTRSTLVQPRKHALDGQLHYSLGLGTEPTQMEHVRARSGRAAVCGCQDPTRSRSAHSTVRLCLGASR